MPPDFSDEDKLFSAKLSDMCRAVLSGGRKSASKFSFFLDEHQRNLAERLISREKNLDFRFFGGYEGASRTVLGVCTRGDFLSDADFPIQPLRFSYRHRPQDELSHRDFLGAAMAAQVRREAIGDILVEDGGAVVFTYETVASVIKELSKVGSVGVRVSEAAGEHFVASHSFLEIKGTVPSMRLDCVASTAVGESRERMQTYIKSNGIDVNYVKCFSASAVLKQGDTFSIRGQGKFILFQIGGKSKKDRYHICLQKYI